MEHLLIFKLMGILALVMGNAFFVASEVALTSARRSRIKQLADMGNKSARIVQRLHNEPERFYSVTQIGITLVSLALGAIGVVTIEHLVDPLFGSISSLFGNSHAVLGLAHTAAYVFGFIVISFLHVVGGELAPKVVAFHKAERLSLAVARIIDTLYQLLAWLIWIMKKSSNGLLWLFHQRDLINASESHFSMSEEEIRTILAASEQEGVLNAEETKMIRGVFDLDEYKVRDAMIPRTDIIAINDQASVDDALKVFQDGHHARYPVYRNDVDHIVGVVTIKELLNAVANKVPDTDAMAVSVTQVMHLPFLIPEAKPLSDLLKDFKQNRHAMAIVLDEFGGTAGLITLEDILEEIVGEYGDELTTRQYRYIKKLSGSQYVIDAGIRVSDLEGAVHFPFPEGDYITLGGLIYSHLGRLPEVGDQVDLDAGRLEILEMDNYRITKVLFQDLAVNDDGIHMLVEDSSPPDRDDAREEPASSPGRSDTRVPPAGTDDEGARREEGP